MRAFVSVTVERVQETRFQRNAQFARIATAVLSLWQLACCVGEPLDTAPNHSQLDIPAPANYPLRDPKIPSNRDHIRPLRLHWGVFR